MTGVHGEALGLRVLAGRAFDASDREGAEPVILISEELARRQFGADDPGGTDAVLSQR